MQLQSQNKSELLAHYKAYYAQMQQLGDTQGIINAMSHLIILEPNIRRQDTLAYMYVSEGKHRQFFFVSWRLFLRKTKKPKNRNRIPIA